MDSLMNLELKNRLEASPGCRLSSTLLFTYANQASSPGTCSTGSVCRPRGPPGALSFAFRDTSLDRIDTEIAK
jgi:hypothetical protein